MAHLAVMSDLFPPEPPAQIHTRPYLGWHRCDCDLVFWLWPLSGLSPSVDTGHSGGPDLRPFQPWVCWRRIKRMTPGRPRKHMEQRHDG